MVTEGGYLLLDDTTWRRRAEKSEAVSWAWSSSAAHIVRRCRSCSWSGLTGTGKFRSGCGCGRRAGSRKWRSPRSCYVRRGRAVLRRSTCFSIASTRRRAPQRARRVRLEVCRAAEVEPPAGRRGGARAVVAPVRARVRAAAQSLSRGVLSVTTIDAFDHLYGEGGLVRHQEKFKEFCRQKSEKLSHIFDAHKEVPNRPLFLFQPESLMIFHLLDQGKFKLREEWVKHFPPRELEQLAIKWGTPYVS
jgi:hypothetical protein